MNLYKGNYYQKGYGKGQFGYGLGNQYFRGDYFQKGYGIGSLFNKFVNWMKPYVTKSMPIVKQGLKSIGEDVIKSASNVALNAIDGKNTIKEEINKTLPKIQESLKNIGKDVLLKNIQEGSGYKRKKKKKKEESNKKRKLDIFDKF